MKYYSYSGAEILIGHFPGNSRIPTPNQKLMEESKNIRFSMPDNIDIVSVITKDHLNTAPLHYQLSLNNVDYINPVKDITVPWKRSEKLKYVLEGLKQCTKDYALILDGDDVCIFNDLDNIVELYKSYGKDIIYNATVYMYPQVELEHIPKRGQYGKYRYLNAGCAIGKTEKMIDFYEAAYEIYKGDRVDQNSEQYYIRKAFAYNKGDVFFDYECKIFQCWHKSYLKHLGEDKLMVY